MTAIPEADNNALQTVKTTAAGDSAARAAAEAVLNMPSIEQTYNQPIVEPMPTPGARPTQALPTVDTTVEEPVTGFQGEVTSTPVGTEFGLLEPVSPFTPPALYNGDPSRTYRSPSTEYLQRVKSLLDNQSRISGGTPTQARQRGFDDVMAEMTDTEVKEAWYHYILNPFKRLPGTNEEGYTRLPLPIPYYQRTEDGLLGGMFNWLLTPLRAGYGLLADTQRGYYLARQFNADTPGGRILNDFIDGKPLQNMPELPGGRALNNFVDSMPGLAVPKHVGLGILKFVANAVAGDADGGIDQAVELFNQPNMFPETRREGASGRFISMFPNLTASVVGADLASFATQAQTRQGSDYNFSDSSTTEFVNPYAGTFLGWRNPFTGERVFDRNEFVRRGETGYEWIQNAPRFLGGGGGQPRIGPEGLNRPWLETAYSFSSNLVGHAALIVSDALNPVNLFFDAPVDDAIKALTQSGLWKGTVDTFMQSDNIAARALRYDINPVRLGARARRALYNPPTPTAPYMPAPTPGQVLRSQLERSGQFFAEEIDTLVARTERAINEPVNTDYIVRGDVGKPVADYELDELADAAEGTIVPPSANPQLARLYDVVDNLQPTTDNIATYADDKARQVVESVIEREKEARSVGNAVDVATPGLKAEELFWSMSPAVVRVESVPNASGGFDTYLVPFRYEATESSNVIGTYAFDPKTRGLVPIGDDTAMDVGTFQRFTEQHGLYWDGDTQRFKLQSDADAQADAILERANREAGIGITTEDFADDINTYMVEREVADIYDEAIAPTASDADITLDLTDEPTVTVTDEYVDAFIDAVDTVIDDLVTTAVEREVASAYDDYAGYLAHKAQQATDVDELDITVGQFSKALDEAGIEGVPPRAAETLATSRNTPTPVRPIQALGAGAPIKPTAPTPPTWPMPSMPTPPTRATRATKATPPTRATGVTPTRATRATPATRATSATAATPATRATQPTAPTEPLSKSKPVKAAVAATDEADYEIIEVPSAYPDVEEPKAATVPEAEEPKAITVPEAEAAPKAETTIAEEVPAPKAETTIADEADYEVEEVPSAYPDVEGFIPKAKATVEPFPEGVTVEAPELTDAPNVADPDAYDASAAYEELVADRAKPVEAEPQSTQLEQIMETSSARIEDAEKALEELEAVQKALDDGSWSTQYERRLAADAIRLGMTPSNDPLTMADTIAAAAKAARSAVDSLSKKEMLELATKFGLQKFKRLNKEQLGSVLKGAYSDMIKVASVGSNVAGGAIIESMPVPVNYGDTPLQLKINEYNKAISDRKRSQQAAKKAQAVVAQAVNDTIDELTDATQTYYSAAAKNEQQIIDNYRQQQSAKKAAEDDALSRLLAAKGITVNETKVQYADDAAQPQVMAEQLKPVADTRVTSSSVRPPSDLSLAERFAAMTQAERNLEAARLLGLDPADELEAAEMIAHVGTIMQLGEGMSPQKAANRLLKFPDGKVPDIQKLSLEEYIDIKGSMPDRVARALKVADEQGFTGNERIRFGKADQFLHSKNTNVRGNATAAENMLIVEKAVKLPTSSEITAQVILYTPKPKKPTKVLPVSELVKLDPEQQIFHAQLVAGDEINVIDLYTDFTTLDQDVLYETLESMEARGYVEFVYAQDGDMTVTDLADALVKCGQPVLSVRFL